MNVRLRGFLLLFLLLYSSFLFASNEMKPPIIDRTVRNISIFNKVYGYVRHFSPSVQVDTFYYWENFLLKGLERVMNAHNDDELCKVILKCFEPFETDLKLSTKAIKKSKKLPCDGKLVYRLNHGWGNSGENTLRPSAVYSSYLDSTDSHRSLEAIYKKIHIQMPLSKCISATQLKQLNRENQSKSYSKSGLYHSTSLFVRWGILLEIWNLNEYFYPYLKQMNIHSDSILENYIRLSYTIDSEEEYFYLLERFAAEYKDGHAAFMPYVDFQDWPYFVPPIKLSLVENKLIVIYSEDTLLKSLPKGTEILKINELDAYKFYEDKKSRVSSATPGWKISLTEKELLCGYKNSKIHLEYKDSNGNLDSLNLSRNINVRELESRVNKRPNLKEFKPGCFYVNLFALNDDSLQEYMNHILPSAQGIIFDTRGYPRTSLIKDLLGHLTLDTLYSSKWSITVMTDPGTGSFYHYRDSSLQWKLSPKRPKYTDNIVFIIDGSIISAGESIMSIVEHYKLGKIVGEQTAGTNGNVHSFSFFGLYQYWHTEMYIPDYEGNSFHGKGVMPDIVTPKPDIQDIQEGRDIFIETAISTLLE